MKGASSKKVKNGSQQELKDEGKYKNSLLLIKAKNVWTP